MPANPKPNQSRFITHLILPDHMKDYQKIQRDGAPGNYFCLKMISKLAPQQIPQNG